MLICTFCNNRQISAVLDRHRQQEAIETEQASIKKLEEAKEERKKEIQKSRENVPSKLENRIHLWLDRCWLRQTN